MLRQVTKAVVLFALFMIFEGCVYHLSPAGFQRDSGVPIAQFQARNQTIQSAAVDAKIVGRMWLGSRELPAIIVLRRPGSFRLEVLSNADELMAITVSDGMRITHYERGADVCYTGDVCQANLEQFLPISIPVTALVDVLLGGGGAVEAANAEVMWDENDGVARLRGVDSSGLGRDVAYDPCSYEVRETSWADSRGRSVQVTMGEFRGPEGERMPEKISVDLEEMNATLEMHYRAVDTKMSIGDDAFAFSCPAGTRVIEMPCDGEDSGG